VNERSRRTALLTGAVVLGLLSILAGALIATSDDGPSERGTSTTPPTATTEPTPSATDDPSPTDEPSPTPARAALADGTHFVYVTDALRRDDGSITVTLDLALFHTGEDAERVAAAHGDEAVNDYYIENDNPRLRKLPIATDATVRYLPVGTTTTELVPGDLDAWLEAVIETSPTDYAGKDVPWWFTVSDGVVTRIEQQYLP